MSEEELKKWFFNKFYSCYPVKYGDNNDGLTCIYYFYDSKFIRQKKLARILDKKIEYPKIVDGYCLFQKLDNILWCDYDGIWLFLENNISNTKSIKNYDKIKSFLLKILKEQEISLIPDLDVIHYNINPNDIRKMRIIK